MIGGRLAASLVLVGAGALGVRAEAPAPVPATGSVTLLADLSDEVRAALAVQEKEVGPASGVELLARVIAAAPSYTFGCGLAAVDTDRRWYATLPPNHPAAPMLELRRWPGDTVLALYQLEGEGSRETPPSIPGASLRWVEGADAERPRWEGRLTTNMGTRPILWIERKVPGVPRRLGALLVPGDAGLGTAAVPDLVLEMLVILARVELSRSAWEVVEGIGNGEKLVLPTLDTPPGDADERRDTWQVQEGNKFTLGLPPGIRARRLDQGVPPPRGVPSASLWLRGRFVDREGVLVVVGDAIRAGYVASIGGADRKWLDGGTAPAGAPSATRIAADDYSLACDPTGALAARAERWREPGFEGEWLVFRLFFSTAGVEIALPVLAGRQSEALFWIPATWRNAGEAPAPPPVDPAARFGIAFEPFTRLEKKRRVWSEGRLTLPGLRLEIPSGWIPLTTLRSEFGFPVTLFDRTGRPVGRIDRVTRESADLVDPASRGWTALRRATARKPTEVFLRADLARLYRTAEGDGILIEPAPGQGTEVAWERLIDSAALLRPQAPKDGSGTRP